VPEAAANAAPTEMACYLPVEANSMVEEFMLLANITVAKAILEAYPESALLRRHPHPQAKDFDFLDRSLSPHGLRLDLSTAANFAASLDRCEKASPLTSHDLP